jgi:hypothetical protein
MGTTASTEERGATNQLWSCTCYLCEDDALWEIGIAGEGERIEALFACELHARGHVHLAIVLPEHTSPRAPYVGLS